MSYHSDMMKYTRESPEKVTLAGEFQKIVKF